MAGSNFRRLRARQLAPGDPRNCGLTDARDSKFTIRDLTPDSDVPCGALLTRVWTQLIHSRIAKMWTMARKFRLSFSNLVANLRMSFMVQKNRSTMLRIL